MTIILDVLSAVGSANPAAAWLVGTSLLARLNASAAFGEAGPLEQSVALDAQVGGSARPAGAITARDGGSDLLLSGRWRIVSGADTAAALVLGTLVSDESVPYVVIVRRDEYELVRDWDVIGMRATGSHSVVIDELRLSRDRVRPMRLTPQFPALGALTVLAPVLGATRAALDATLDLVRSGRRPTGLQADSLATSPAARALLSSAIGRVDDAERLAAEGTRIAATDPQTARHLFARSAECARMAFEPMLDLHGASAFGQNTRIGMLWRDVAVGSRHALTTAYLFADQEVDAVVGGM